MRTDPLQIVLAAHLKELRLDRDIRQLDVAEALQVTNATISYCESARYRISVPTFVRWCGVLGVDPAEVLATAMSQLPEFGGKLPHQRKEERRDA